MSIDLLVHAGTKFALHQWLDARNLGSNVQDTDPGSPTFGEYQYTHEVGLFHYWNHPSGIVPLVVDNTDPENPVVTNRSGFYAMLKLPDAIPTDLKTWVETSTAVSVLEGIEGVGGEGVTILNPEDLYAAVRGAGLPVWGGLLGVSNQWSDPALWAFQNTMTGDQREFNGVMYESLIDFNVWSPTQYPAGWTEVGPAAPAIEPWVQPTGAQDAYPLGAQVTHNGQTWENNGSDANVWEPGVFGWVVV